MKRNELFDLSRALQIDIPNTSRHKQELRRTLLQTEPHRQSFALRTFETLITPCKGVSMKKIIPAGVGLGAIALVIGATIALSPVSPTASAQTITHSGNKYVSQLSSDELATIKKKLASDDPGALLKEAAAAQDLKQISRTEADTLLQKPTEPMPAANFTPADPSKVRVVEDSAVIVSASTPDEMLSLTNPTKFVSYTNSQGNVVVIGFDDADAPVFKAVL